MYNIRRKYHLLFSVEYLKCQLLIPNVVRSKIENAEIQLMLSIPLTLIGTFEGAPGHVQSH